MRALMSILRLGALAVLTACATGGHAPAPGSAPASTPSPAGAAAPAIAPAPGSAPAPQPAPAAFQPTDAAFAAWFGALRPLALPVDLPPAKAAVDAARSARVDRPERVCEPHFFDCTKLGPSPTLFVLGRLAISDDTAGALVHGEGPKGSATALVTWNEAGQLVGGQILGADFGQQWGYSGRLSADLKVERNRWVGQPEEFADHQTFRVRPSGAVELTVE